jgi:ribonuclease P protein component
MDRSPPALWDRAARLVRKSDFEAVYRRGGRLKSPQFVVFYGANGGPCSRFGISVKKALGGAVVRNRIRRRIREILRQNLLEIPSGWDFVMHPRRSVASSNFATLQTELVGLLRNIRSEAPTGVPRPAKPAGT